MEQQFSLSWNNFHGNLTKGFTGLLGKGEFVDVTIAVDGHLLQAHKVILSICSPYFKKMFQMNPCQHPIVVLRDVTHKAMRDLLQFMYHGEVSVKREDLTSFIGTAEVLQIKGLTNKETDEDEIEKERDLPNHSNETHNNTPDRESCTPETFDTSVNNDNNQNNELDILKQRNFIQKLQRFSNMKRKSEEFLQKNYYQDLLNSEKRIKLKEINAKPTYCKNNQTNFDHLNSAEENHSDSDFNGGNMQSGKNVTDICDEQTYADNVMEMKTECDDSDIIVTDPAVCTPPKNYDGPIREGHKDMLHLDYQSPQDNCTGLNSLFTDLKNLVNGKMCNVPLRNSIGEENPRNMSDHRLITIPQKEDGKKKYPQRSCRLCWKIGKRRDTRFMCNACEMPFCKSPCFEIHFNDMLKTSQVQVDLYGKIRHAI